MRKFAKIVLSILLICSICFGLLACDKNKFTVNEEFKNSSSTSAAIQGGFIAEVDNYYYFINGIGDSSDDNDYGDAMNKGSLVAVKKDDLSKCAVVVPKLFVATDYNAGIYIIDGYVYFATPSTDKKLTGETKTGYLTFAKAKLDGSEYKEFITVEGLSTEYRFAKTDAGVVVVYYDSTDTALYSYNTETKAKITIAKTDEEADKSLDTYKFFDSKDLDKGIVAYTLTVYKGEFIEETTRSTEDYNEIYLYKAGAENSELYLSGNKTLYEQYELKSIINGEILYKETDVYNTDGTVYLNTVEVDDSDVYDSTFIKDSNNVYTYDSDNTLIKYGDEVFAKASDITTLLFIDGDYIYYISSDNYLKRIAKDTASTENVTEKISEGTIATDWFKPVKIGDLIFYCDNTTTGGSNIKYVDLTGNKLEQEDDDGCVEYKYFENQKFLADSLRTDAEKAEDFNALFTDLTDSLDDGRITDDTKTLIEAIKTEYVELTDEQKEIVNDNYDILSKYEDAIALAEICKDLKDIEKIDTATASANETYKTAYEKAKAKFDELFSANDQTYVDEVGALMEGNTCYWFGYANESVFTDTED